MVRTVVTGYTKDKKRRSSMGSGVFFYFSFLFLKTNSLLMT